MYFMEADAFSVLWSYLQCRVYWISSKSWATDLSPVFCPRWAITVNAHDAGLAPWIDIQLHSLTWGCRYCKTVAFKFVLLALSLNGTSYYFLCNYVSLTSERLLKRGRQWSESWHVIPINFITYQLPISKHPQCCPDVLLALRGQISGTTVNKKRLAEGSNISVENF